VSGEPRPEKDFFVYFFGHKKVKEIYAAGEQKKKPILHRVISNQLSVIKF
jgi:hypothetical protein